MKWRPVLLTLLLTCCGSDPVSRTYVLSPPVDPVARAVSEAGRPVLEVRRVSVPDYLDTTDIVSRDGRNELKVSSTGHWGERLSVGITDALAADLRRRPLPFLIVGPAFSGQPAREVAVDVDAFDVRQDGSCVLTARWTILGEDQKPNPGGQLDTFVTYVTRTAEGTADAAVSAAMAGAIDQLAGKIGSGLALTSGGR
jgi:uncharacterized lipoprotein YmbA